MQDWLAMALAKKMGGGSGGGSAGGGDERFTTGTFTLAEDTTNYVFAEFEKSKYKTGYPSFVAVRRIDGYKTTGDYSWLVLTSSHLQGKIFQVGTRNTSNGRVFVEYCYTSTDGSTKASTAGIQIYLANQAEAKGSLKLSCFENKMIAGAYAYIFGDLD